MVWFNVDDTASIHPKQRTAGLEAVGLWTVAGAYCAQVLSEGFVPEWYVLTWPKGRALAARLVAARLWYRAERDGATGWQFHDWQLYNRTKEQVDRDRAKARARQQAKRDRERHGVTTPVTHAVTTGVSNGVSNGVSHGPQAVPSQAKH